MEYCGKTWLKSSPPHVLALSYSIAAIQYHVASGPNQALARNWCVYPKVPRFTTSQIQDAAKYYTGKRDALWKCRVARALETAQDYGPYHAEQALRKIKDKNVRWEADLALARLFVRKSQWDNAIACAQDSLSGLIAISAGQAYYKFAFDCNKLIAECFKQKLKAMPMSDAGYNQSAMMAAEYLRRAVRFQPNESNLLNETVSAFHGVALRLMVEGMAIDAEEFLEDDFSASEFDDDDSSVAEAGSPSRHSEAPKSRSELNASKERLSKSSISNASVFRTMSHGSDQGHESRRDSWKDGSNSIAELRAISSPRLYFDNFDENLNSDVCHGEVMTLLRDLDGASVSNTIVGYEESDGFEYSINIERNRLYQRLSQVLELNPRLVNIMAFAACRSDYMTWFVELFERAITFEGQQKRQRQLMFLNTHLGTVLSVYAGKHDDAIHIWQSVVDQKLPSTRKSGVASLVQAEASKHLSRLCISRASSDVSRADEYIKIAESLSASTIGTVPSQIGTQRMQTKIHLATWYHNQGELAKARSLVQDDVLWALDILTDEDPANDFNGFYVLANVLRAVQDDRNHLAARHAMRQYGEDDSAISTADKKQKATNNTDAFCSGLCLQEHKQWDKMSLCRSCPDLNLCPNCFSLFKSNDLYLNICDPGHEFLYVPRMKHSFTRGNQVVVAERVVELDDWVAELRKEWQTLDSTAAEPTSRWRRHSSRLLGSEDVKTERKREKLWRLFSHDKDKDKD